MQLEKKRKTPGCQHVWKESKNYFLEKSIKLLRSKQESGATSMHAIPTFSTSFQLLHHHIADAVSSPWTNSHSSLALVRIFCIGKSPILPEKE